MFSSQLVYIGSINPIINISAVNIPYIDYIVYETEFHAYTNPIIIKFTNVKFDKIFEITLRYFVYAYFSIL